MKQLSWNKSLCPSNNILNEYFIESVDIIGGHLTDLFNIGYLPEKWAHGYIIQIHKKGCRSDPNNYRDITLLINYMVKLFTSILTARVEKWCDNNNMLSVAQFGFRKGFSTVDAIFALPQGSCLQKVFDSVYRQALWFKLYHLGLDGKLLKCFKYIYNIVNSCVKHSESFSDFFNISISISPVIFSLFLEDLELFLQGTIK